MRVTKTFKFEAAHQLPNKDIYGKCKNLHGHSYVLEVEVEGPITNEGWVINFSELGEIVDPYIKGLDHSFIESIQPSTAENIVRWLANEISEDLKGEKIILSRLTLWETAKCSVTILKDEIYGL